MHYRSIYHLNPYCSNMLLCSLCGYLAVNFNRSKVFLFFFVGGQKYFETFSCISRIYHIYL